MQQPLDSPSRSKKKLIFLGSDVLSVVVALYLSIALRYGAVAPFSTTNVSPEIIPVMAALGPVIIMVFGQYRMKLHAIEAGATMRIALLVDDTPSASTNGDATAVRGAIEGRIDGYRPPDADGHNA